MDLQLHAQMQSEIGNGPVIHNYSEASSLLKRTKPNNPTD